MGGRFGEFALLVILVLLLFGPNKLPDLARAVGQALREFKKASNPDSAENASSAPAASQAQAPSLVAESKGSRKKKSSVIS